MTRFIANRTLDLLINIKKVKLSTVDFSDELEHRVMKLCPQRIIKYSIEL